MKQVTAYKSTDGILEEKEIRAYAHELEHFLPKSFTDSNSKVLNFSQCLAVLENKDLIKEMIKGYENAIKAADNGH